MPHTETLEGLLEDFSKVPKINSPSPTLIEIAGFPHYENVCSNILAHYFDTSNNHGLKNLLVKSLLENVDKEFADQVVQTIEVTREVPTLTNKRIDILIKADDFIIAIENKVYADLYNDLNDYSHYIANKHAESKNQIKVVLSLYKVPSYKLVQGFVNVLYSDFIRSIQSNIGGYMFNAESKSLVFLLDFLTTMQNLTKPQIMDENVLKFFIDNKEKIDELLKEKSDLNRFVANKVNQLKTLIDPLEENVNQWIWAKYTLVHDFNINETVVAVDINFDIDGIEICVWIRKGNVPYSDYFPLLEYFKVFPLHEFQRTDKGVFVLEKQSMPLLTPIVEIANKLNLVLRGIRIV